VKELKYIGYWEHDLKDWDEAWKKNSELGKAVNENPENYPEFILGPHYIGGSNKGVTVFETDDPKKLLNISIPLAPYVKWKFVPLYSAYESNQIYEDWIKK